MVLLTISSIGSWGVLLILLALIIWFFANNAIKKLLFGDEFANIEKPASGSLKVVDGKNVTALSKGFNINLQGVANKVINNSFAPKTFAVKPSDWVGLQPIPKMMVKEGQSVLAGDVLFIDRKMEGIFFTAPVSGVVSEIKRGDKRAITAVIITPDAQPKFKNFKKAAVSSLSKEEVLAQIVESGAFTSITQRPFGLPALPNATPKAIFISAFDTAPLAADLDFVIDNLSSADFQAGLDALAKLTNKVHLNVRVGSNAKYTNAKNVQVNYFEGKDPAGRVGVQIHHIDAIKKGEMVWTIRPQDVATIGKLFNEGIYDPTEVVAVAGTPFAKTFYVKTKKGASMSSLVQGIDAKANRFISGNVLTGKQITADDYIGAQDSILTSVKEGTDYEMFGWLVPQYLRPSISPTFPWSTNEKIAFDANTNSHGEHRAFVVTGQYEEVLPMDIFPVHLLKAILAEDFEQIEGLGIYEVIEEDLALCEFVCTSKQPVQKILREGLDYIYSQS